MVQRSGLPSRTALLLCTSFCHSNLEAVDRHPNESGMRPSRLTPRGSCSVGGTRESRFRARAQSDIHSNPDVRVPLNRLRPRKLALPISGRQVQCLCRMVPEEISGLCDYRSRAHETKAEAH
jgi:hypothetical protein